MDQYFCSGDMCFYPLIYSRWHIEVGRGNIRSMTLVGKGRKHTSICECVDVKRQSLLQMNEWSHFPVSFPIYISPHIPFRARLGLLWTEDGFFCTDESKPQGPRLALVLRRPHGLMSLEPPPFRSSISHRTSLGTNDLHLPHIDNACQCMLSYALGFVDDAQAEGLLNFVLVSSSVLLIHPSVFSSIFHPIRHLHILSYA